VTQTVNACYHSSDTGRYATSVGEYFAPFFRLDAEHRFVAMIRGYFDDSGTHAASRIAVVGGILADDVQHDRLKETWDTILARHQLPYFHLTRFKAGREAPYCTMSEWDKETLLDQLVRIMCIRKVMSFACAIPIADYEAVVTEEEQTRYGSPYAWALQMCYVIIRLWAERHNYNDPIPFVVESGNRDQEYLSVVFNRAMADPILKRHFRLHSLVHADKIDFPGLQAADIIANSTHELATHYKMGGRTPTKWMNAVARHIKNSLHKELILNQDTLRSETDGLNEYHREAIAAQRAQAGG
jgi:hypothetical protein